MKRNIVIVVVVLLVGLIGYRLFSNKKHIDSKKEVVDNTDFKVSVNVAKVQSKTSEQKLTLVGTVAANQQLDIKSEVAGKVIALNIKLGDYVSKGRTLARIDNTLREITVSTAEQSLADAKQNVDRYKNLFEGGAATKAQYDQYKLAYENAKNQVDQAKKQLNDALVIAPISGYVTSKNVEMGAFVSIGSPITTLVDVSSLKVQLNVPESDVYKLKVGDAIAISATVFPGITYKGRVNFVSVMGDASHNYPVEISIQNNSKYPLKAGTYVDVAFAQKTKTSVLQIPREAMLGSLKDAKVYVVDTAKNIVTLRHVVLGADFGNFMEVLKGLNAGEQVVTSGQINLTDSTRVTIIK